MPVINYLNTSFFDHGALKRLPGQLTALGVGRPFIVTDPGLKAAGLVDQVIDAMGAEPVYTFSDTVPNPTETQTKEVVALYKAHDADGIIALGGGSAMDQAKAVSLLATHDKPLETFAAMSGGS
ncbi:MAG: iron-containing alcohol dehydrogenase, partial [Pseudomonadota bacterium]